MKVTWQKAGAILGTIVAAAAIVTASYNFVVWIDDIFVDKEEVQALFDKQLPVLQIMNDNIVNIGSAIYDRKLDEIDQWIKDLVARTDRNPAEDAFLVTLRQQRKEVQAKKDKLKEIKVGP